MTKKPKARKCKYCDKPFTPDKLHSWQKTCTKKECQRARQIDNQRTWRKNNPDYFRYARGLLPHHKEMSDRQASFRAYEKAVKEGGV